MLAFQERSTECSTGVVPVPLRDRVVGELLVLLTKVTEPVTLPLAWGAKLTLTCWVPPAAIVTGKMGDRTVNSAPVALAEKTVTLEFPVFVRVAFLLLLLPTATLPNESVNGETVSVRTGVGVAVPEIPTGARLFAASLVITRLPV